MKFEKNWGLVCTSSNGLKKKIRDSNVDPASTKPT